MVCVLDIELVWLNVTSVLFIFINPYIEYILFAIHRYLLVLIKCCWNKPYDSYFRFLRHVPVVYVDYPGKLSLCQIYGTFNRAMLRLVPSLKPYAEPLTNAMVEFYLMSQVNYRERYWVRSRAATYQSR